MESEKVRYTILRDSQKRPTVTICSIAVNGEIGIGIAIRSMKDNPVEKVGKVKAYGRAKKALYRREHTLSVYRKEAFDSIHSTREGRNNKISFDHKSQYFRA